MRRVALTTIERDGIRRVILHATDHGTYLYLSRSVDDAGAFADQWYESVADAEAAACDRFGIATDAWTSVADPEPGCQHDWIAPVRVKGRPEARSRLAQLERLVDGKWVDIPED